MDNATPFPASGGFERRDRGGLRRLRDMRFAEIAYRGWQEASKWLERVGPLEPTDQPEALLRDQAPELADPAHALRVLREMAPGRFFPGVQDLQSWSALEDNGLPAHKAAVIAHADALLARHFDQLGRPIDVEVTGENRFIWEQNRHQWLVHLAQASVMTGDERYAVACMHAIDAWLAANPPGLGINWSNSFEVSLRMISWCWTLMLLRDSPAVSGAWVTRVLAGLCVHAAHVRRHLSHYSSPTTHLTGEALGLFYIATLFPEFGDAPRWRELSVDTLVAESKAQVSRDGVHFEQSTCYQRYAVDTYMHFLLLAARNGEEIPGHVSERVQQMVDFLLVVRQPDSTIPAIGDDDGGALLPLANRATSDGGAIFAVAASMFRRADFLWAADGPAPEVLWLMGLDGLRAVDDVRPAPPGRAASRVFPSGGYAVMRSNWDSGGHQMIVDVGPLGCPVSSGHGHSDFLSVQCSIFGEPVLVDAGTYCYTAEPEWREFFRSSAAHSSIMIDGRSQAKPTGPFGWKRQPRGRLREWHSTPEFDFLDADHEGYLRLPDPVLHRRRVIFVKPGFWMIVDDLSGAARHDIDLTFQFAPIDVSLGTHPWARAKTPNGRVLWVSPFPSAPVQSALKCGELAPIRGWISRGYGHREPAPMLIYSLSVALPYRIVTLLLPDRQGATSPPAVRGLYDDAGLPIGVAFDRPRRVVRFDDSAVSVERE